MTYFFFGVLRVNFMPPASQSEGFLLKQAGSCSGWSRKTQGPTTNTKKHLNMLIKEQNVQVSDTTGA